MKHLPLLAAAAALLAVATAAIAVVTLQRQVRAPFQGYEGDHVDVVVRPRMAARQIADMMEEAGVVESAALLTGWLWWTERSGDVQAGEYRFIGLHSVVEVAEVVTSGRVQLYAVTITEGSTRWQVAEAIAVAGFDSYEAALAATGRIDLIEDLDPMADTLEGYLFPETYLAPRSDHAEDLVVRMVEAFHEAWTPAYRRRAAELEMSVRAVVTLASLIEAETQTAQERPVVSGVFHNRLARGMLLQTDPTVIYARHLAGREGRTIYQSDLRRDSPYNTYLYPGLPVGPIGNPRWTSVDAALYPADVDFLYFVSRNDGTHAFSQTLAEHNELVARYQR